MESLDQQLLHAALLCGLEPGKGAAYRLQLFMIANRDLGSKSHQSDFQRSIETAVEKKGFFENHQVRGSGEYVITQRGYSEARSLLGNISAKYNHVPKDQFRLSMRGAFGGMQIEISTHGTNSTIRLGGEKMPSAVDACRRIEMLTSTKLPTKGESAVRVLQNFAVDHEFEIEFT